MRIVLNPQFGGNAIVVMRLCHPFLDNVDLSRKVLPTAMRHPLYNVLCPLVPLSNTAPCLIPCLIRSSLIE